MGTSLLCYHKNPLIQFDNKIIFLGGGRPPQTHNTNSTFLLTK